MHCSFYANGNMLYVILGSNNEEISCGEGLQEYELLYIAWKELHRGPNNYNM